MTDRTAEGPDTRERRLVLVAEDNEMHQMVLRRVMREVEKDAAVRLDLEFVGDGEKLLARLRAAQTRRRDDGPDATPGIPDVVLLDLHMPNLSGLDVLKALAADESLRRIPVVVLSSSDQAHHVDEAYASGANAYLVKLGDHVELAAQMRRFSAFWLETAQLPRSGAE